MIRAIGFDLDNTLYDQTFHLFPFYSAASQFLSRETGVQASALESDFRRIWASFGPSYPTLLDDVLSLHGILTRERVDRLLQMHRTCSGPLELYAGVRPMLERLRETYSLFLITDGNAEMQRCKIESLRIAPLFQTIVLSSREPGGCAKPHPAPFLSALRQLGCTAGECVFVGDNPKCDISGAGALGMRTIRVLTGPFRNVVAEVKPDCIVSSAAAIEHFIK